MKRHKRVYFSMLDSGLAVWSARIKLPQCHTIDYTMDVVRTRTWIKTPVIERHVDISLEKKGCYCFQKNRISVFLLADFTTDVVRKISFWCKKNVIRPLRLTLQIQNEL